MDYFFTEEQQETRKLARRIAEEHMRPIRAELDETGEFPWEIVKMLGQAGLFALLIPEEYGGLGGGVMDFCLVTEELSRVCSGIALAYAATGLGVYPLIMFGNEEQKRRLLPAVAEGKRLTAFALTEANAGSDAAAVRTRAVRDGDYYVINGTKQWITNGGEAEIYTVITSTDPDRGARGMTAFIVEKGQEGFDFGKKENKMGIRGSTTRELIFTDCRVHKDNILKREGYGFIITMKTFDKTRPGIGAQAVGVAQGAFEEAAKYAIEREQFGKTIASFQAIRHILADMATKIEAARALVYAVARMIDSGAKDVSKESAMAKVFASDVAMEVTTNAVQVFGGYGYMKEYPVEKMMRDAKITQIYEGTNQIQREVIGLKLVKEAGKL